jgi:hypothetical protein
VDNDHQLALALLKLGAVATPLLVLLFLLKIIRSTEKNLGRFADNMLNNFQKAGNKGANLGNKLARNSAPGQAVQEYMNTRRAASKIRGQEMYRSVGNRFPFLNTSRTQRQLFDAQNMKNYQEEVGRARGMMTTNVARVMGDVRSNAANGYDPNAGMTGANLARVRQEQGYKDSSGNFIALSQEDMNSMQRLETAGFLGGQNNRAGATAAMDELFDQQFVERRHIDNLTQTAGNDPESSALMTNSIRAAAGRNKYKNYQYGHVVNGNYQQWTESPGTKDGVSIVQSGVQGVPKEMFEDDAILAGFTHKIAEAQRTGKPEEIQRAIVDIARQTSHVDKAKIVDRIATSVGLSSGDFNTIRQSIQTNTLSNILPAAGAPLAGTPFDANFGRTWGARGSGTDERKQADKIIAALNDQASKRYNGRVRAGDAPAAARGNREVTEVTSVVTRLP